MADDLLVVQLNLPFDETQGDYFYRAFVPGRALASLPNVYVINLTNEHRYRLPVIEEADVLIVNMVCDLDLYPLIERRRKAGFLTVYELNDDVFNIPDCNPKKGFYDNSFNRQVQILLMASADAMQFSTTELQRKYGAREKASTVFPNHLGIVPPPRSEPHYGPPMIAGWGGSLGHLDDLKVFSGFLCQWCRRRDDVVLNIMGAPGIWELFESVPPERKILTPPGSMEDYHRFLGGLDVGIAPLLDNEYNRCRSDVKYLEYASHQVAPVVQRAPSYLDIVEPNRTGLLFATAGELLHHLDRLADDPPYRLRLATAARDHVCRLRNPQRDAIQRIRFYRDLMRRLGRKTVTRPARQRYEKWAALEGARRYERCLVLLPTAFEAALRMGLAALDENNKEAARRCFREASHLVPESYLPDLYLATCEDDPEPFLKRALHKNPQCLMAYRLMETRAR